MFFKNSMSISPPEVEQISKELLAYNITKSYTMHCMGMKTFGIMKAVMNDRLKYLATGEKIQL
jgi:7,8-dihydropterin-6-yl-methyl-4-(beta-D-ribofuranosyl)aminobenzene 5'-phosphate synthase